MEAYRDAPATFFGMKQRTAAVTFNTKLKAGELWCEVVEGLLVQPKDAVDAYFRDKISLVQLSRFKDMLDLHVHDERSLFCYLSKTTGSRKQAIEGVLGFFMFNFNDPKSQLLFTRAQQFSKELVLQIGKELRQPPTRELAALDLF
jgi:hypothetical protein